MYFGTSHIIKVYNTDIPFVDLNKYNTNRVIHLAQQKKKEKGSSTWDHNINSVVLNWAFSYHYSILIQEVHWGDNQEKPQKWWDIIEKQWWKIQHLFSNEGKEMIINDPFINFFSFKYRLLWCTIHHLKA